MTLQYKIFEIVRPTLKKIEILTERSSVPELVFTKSVHLIQEVSL